jgi:metal-responsive CopG/Arc/MetJ family transcriptional regulator
MGNPRNPANERVSTSIRIPSDLLDEVDRVAAQRILGRARLIELLLRDGLDRLAALDCEDTNHVR